MKVEVEGFDRILAKLKHLEADTKAITEEALTETHAIVTAKAEQAMSAANLPRGGKYSTGRTLSALRQQAVIEWKGTEAEVPVGFDIKQGGLTSIFLMYGTPAHGPAGKSKRARGGHPGTDQVVELYNAFFGNSTKKEIIAAQEAVFYGAIRRLEG